jgi:hypothetical protein
MAFLYPLSSDEPESSHPLYRWADAAQIDQDLLEIAH